MTAIFNGGGQAQRMLLQRVLNVPPQARYWRFQTVLQEASFAMDDARPNNLAGLQRDAERLLAEQAASLQPLLSLLVPR